MILWSVFLLLVACIWASRHITIQRAKGRQISLDSSTYTGLSADPPRVSVLIAAKDEEANIETAVRSMLEQDYPDFEVIAINDRSEDRTGEILESIRAADSTGRLRVIHVEQLREGWFGKNNAMREGVEQASGTWFCFGDADCRQTSRRSLSIAVQHALRHNIDFLSILPRLETQTLWERIIQPVCAGVMVLWFNPDNVNNPRHSAAYANGAFMLMSRKCYETIGGHELVRTHVNEDMHMARIAKERQQRLVVVQNRDLYTVRMYSKFSEIWRGWSRIFYGCFGTFRRLRITMMVMLFTNVFPYLSLLLSAGVLAAQGWQEAGTGWQWVAGASACAVVFHQTVIARFYRISQTKVWLAPTFIVGAVICIGMLFSAMLKVNGHTTTTWRGTTYRGNELANPSPKS